MFDSLSSQVALLMIPTFLGLIIFSIVDIIQKRFYYSKIILLIMVAMYILAFVDEILKKTPFK